MTKIALHPAHPERVCWGCDKYCADDDLRCGNGTVRTMHPCELFGDDWLEWPAQKKMTKDSCSMTAVIGRDLEQ